MWGFLCLLRSISSHLWLFWIPIELLRRVHRIQKDANNVFKLSRDFFSDWSRVRRRYTSLHASSRSNHAREIFTGENRFLRFSQTVGFYKIHSRRVHETSHVSPRGFPRDAEGDSNGVIRTWCRILRRDAHCDAGEFRKINRPRCHNLYWIFFETILAWVLSREKSSFPGRATGIGL